MLGRRDGPFFFDAYDGRRFYNCHCNGGVFNLGHRHPAIVAALRESLDEIDVGNHHLVSGWKAALGARLAATTDGRLPGVVLTPSGSEAVEVAIKSAFAATGRRGVVSAHGAYHGHTGLAAMAADEKYHAPYGLELPGFAHVPWDDLDAIDAAIGDDTAIVLLETVPATLGMPLPSDGYLAGVQALCRDAAPCSRSTRCRPVSDVRVGCGATSTTVSSPTWSSRARGSAAGCTRWRPRS